MRIALIKKEKENVYYMYAQYSFRKLIHIKWNKNEKVAKRSKFQKYTLMSLTAIYSNDTIKVRYLYCK